MNDAFIYDAIRTPIGRFGGMLSSLRTDDLGALPLKALMARNPGVEWSLVDGFSGGKIPLSTYIEETAGTKRNRPVLTSTIWSHIPDS